MITGGRNLGRVGTVVNRERHPGSFDIVHIKDANGHVFATRWVISLIETKILDVAVLKINLQIVVFICRLNNVFIIGKGTKTYISLPKGKGVKLSIAEERDKRLASKAKSLAKR